MKGNKKRSRTVKPGTKAGRCPYCRSTIVLRSADGIYKDNSSGTYLYVCSRYPECDAYVRVLPGTSTPVGRIANGSLRSLRREAHRHFDLLYQTGLMTRSEAYFWLATILQAPLSQAHIGYLGDYYCKQVIEESKRMLANRRKAQNGWPESGPQRAVGGELYAVI